jgi:hypothetical protein
MPPVSVPPGIGVDPPKYSDPIWFSYSARRDAQSFWVVVVAVVGEVVVEVVGVAVIDEVVESTLVLGLDAAVMESSLVDTPPAQPARNTETTPITERILI